jgi:histidinol-phosphate aminotransferase
MKEYHPPLSGREGLRLDFNENTDAPSPRVAEVMKRIAGQEITKYPERAPVEAVMAGFLNVSREQLLLTNGVDEAIHLICETFLEPGDEAIIVVPTFSMYEIYAQSTGACVISVMANPQQGFQFPTQKVLDAIGDRTRLIAMASPNNPTGTVVAREELLRIIEAAPQAAVLIDEAYYEFFGQTLLDVLPRYTNLFIARTFSKAYGMAGLRAGVLVGSFQHMPMVRKVSSPYNVNAIALACLPEAVADRSFTQNYVNEVLQGRKQFIQALEEFGVPYWPSEANFVLAAIGPLHREFVIEMRERGILVRDRSADPGCDGCVRITIGKLEHTIRLLTALPIALARIGWKASQVRGLRAHARGPT